VTETSGEQPTADQLTAEIAAARDNLAITLEQIKAETSPQALARRGVNAVRGFFTDEFGGVRPERVAIAAGVVVSVVVFRKWRKSRRNCHCH
jgi:hypothetical protein